MRGQKRDRNEPEVRRRAEALGFLWLENNASTKGRPDVCLLRNGQTFWCEVKAPGEPFTRAQMEEFPRLIAKGVPVYVLERPDDVSSLDIGVLRAWAPSDVTTTVSRGRGSRAKKPRDHQPGYSKARLGHHEMCIAPHCVRSALPGLGTCAMCTGGDER